MIEGLLTKAEVSTFCAIKLQRQRREEAVAIAGHLDDAIA